MAFIMEDVDSQRITRLLNFWRRT